MLLMDMVFKQSLMLKRPMQPQQNADIDIINETVVNNDKDQITHHLREILVYENMTNIVIGNGMEMEMIATGTS